jgi:hypothetical protein
LGAQTKAAITLWKYLEEAFFEPETTYPSSTKPHGMMRRNSNRLFLGTQTSIDVQKTLLESCVACECAFKN